jgi:hypothetical protein
MVGFDNNHILLLFLIQHYYRISCIINPNRITSNKVLSKIKILVILSLIYLFSRRILRLVGTQDPFKLFLDLERIKKKWFYAQDTRQISKRKKFTQYVLDTRKFFNIYFIFNFILIKIYWK